MKKNEYFVKQFFFVPPPYGGISIYVKRLTERLNKDGYITGAYYTKYNNNLNYKNSPLFHEFQWLNPINFLFRFSKLIQETRNYKIVHSHFGLGGMVFLWGLSFFCNKKIVVTIHNSWSDNYYKNTSFINRFFLKQNVKRDFTWIAVSEEARRKMEELPVKFNYISVIPAFIKDDTQFNESEILDASLINFLKKKKKVILFYGHAFITKDGDVYGYKRALEMFDILMQNYTYKVCLIMCIGENNIEEINKLKYFAEQKNINDDIYWQIGPINEMNAIWQHTDIYIIPTNSDGDSVAIREALGLGIKVVASDVCKRPEGTCTYSFDDKEDFAQKVLDCLNSENQEVTGVDYYHEMLSIYKNLSSF